MRDNETPVWKTLRIVGTFPHERNNVKTGWDNLFFIAQGRYSVNRFKNLAVTQFFAMYQNHAI